MPASRAATAFLMAPRLASYSAFSAAKAPPASRREGHGTYAQHGTAPRSRRHNERKRRSKKEPETPGNFKKEVEGTGAKAPAQLDEARLQVDQVTNIMRGNVDKIMERDGKLQDLETKAEQLQADSQQFQKTVIKVKRKAWLENMKMKLDSAAASSFSVRGLSFMA